MIPDHLAVVARVAFDLRQSGTPFALVGGMAVIAHGSVRLTKDIDVAVAVTDDREAERLVRQLTAADYRIANMLEDVATGRLCSVRLLTPLAASSAPDCALLLHTCGIEAEIARDAILVPMLRSDFYVPVARRGHLIAMKLLTLGPHRAQDRAQDRAQGRGDLTALLANASTTDLAEARIAIELMTARGMTRDRDLLEDLAGILHGSRPDRA